MGHGGIAGWLLAAIAAGVLTVGTASQPQERDDKREEAAEGSADTKASEPEAPRGGGGAGGGGGPPPAKVRLGDVRLESVERWREVTGELRAVRRATVAAEEPGQVIEIVFDAGDSVEQGQVIAKLDDERVKLEVERVRATIRTREALITEQSVTLEKAKRDLQRIEDSYSRNGASQIELDNIRTTVASSDAKLAQARSELAYAQSDLRLAEKRLADMTVKAPFSGVVVAKRTEVGQWVREGDTVLELVALDAIDAWLDVPEAFAARLLPTNGAAVEVVLRVPSLMAVGANPEIRAMVSSVIPSADPLSRLFPVRVRLENTVRGAAGASQGPLRPGMTVVGQVPTGEPKEALTISKDAVLRNESGSYVYFDAGGVSAIAPVRVEYAVGERVVVQSPALKPGMKVVVEGNERMFPGQPLAVQGEAPAVPPTK